MKIRRGRPTGYKLSQESKDKIAASRTGQKHTEATKQRIGDEDRFRRMWKLY